MSYCIHQSGNDFEIKASGVEPAKVALIKLFETDSMFHWITMPSDDKPRVCPCCHQSLPTKGYGDFAHYMGEMDFNVDWENGAVAAICFEGEREPDGLLLFFNALAAFVVDGSWIEFTGEDGTKWRYVFDGERAKEIRAKVSWDD